MLIILRGPAASGKSTFVKELQDSWLESHLINEPLVVVSRDALRLAMFGANDKSYYDVSKDLLGTREDFISVVEKRAVRDALSRGHDVISDNTNLTPRFTNALVDIAYQLGHEVELVDHFKYTPLEECLKRNAARERKVDEAILIKQWHRAQEDYTLPEQPAEVQPYVPDESLPEAVLIDLDGTAALLGDRDPYDDLSAHLDSPNESVRTTAWGVYQIGTEIVYVSARQERSRGVTSLWLDEHRFPPGRLIMRATGDQRKDWVVKNEIFDTKIAPHYNVLFCLDDRQQVVDMYRRKGLAVHQVAEGNF